MPPCRRDRNCSAMDTLDSQGRPSLGRMHSKEVYERLLKEKGPSLEVCLAYANHLADRGNLVGCLEALQQASKFFPLTVDTFRPIISKLVEHIRNQEKEPQMFIYGKIQNKWPTTVRSVQPFMNYKLVVAT